MFAKAITLSGLASLACAHIVITNPVPYGKNSLNNSPLDASGSDFPCKQRPGVYDAEGASNVYAQGSTQQLAFLGTAVHGGGSCQVSITTDLKPTKDSVWKVIKSIEGGCPAKGQTGNMGSNAGAEVPFKYDFDIPTELAAGNYTLAWTWFNKVGNREMYMNCAPMTVTGSDGSDSFMDGLPDMFVANVGNGCGTPAGTDLQFPNAGKFVDQFNGQTDAFAAPTGTCQKPSGGNGGGNGGNGGGNSGSSPTTPAGGAQPTKVPVNEPTAPATPSNKLPGGVFITKPADEPSQPSEPANTQPAVDPAPVDPVPTEEPVPSAPSAPSAPGNDAPNPAPGNGGGSSPSGGYASGTACTDEGAWNCIEGKSFQRCASGMWSPVQAMAAGVTCEAGVSTEFKMTAIAGKRAMRRALRMRA